MIHSLIILAQTRSLILDQSGVAFGGGLCKNLAALEITPWSETGKAILEEEFQTAKLCILKYYRCHGRNLSRYQ